MSSDIFDLMFEFMLMQMMGSNPSEDGCKCCKKIECPAKRDSLKTSCTGEKGKKKHKRHRKCCRKKRKCSINDFSSIVYVMKSVKNRKQLLKTDECHGRQKHSKAMGRRPSQISISSGNGFCSKCGQPLPESEAKHRLNELSRKTIQQPAPGINTNQGGYGSFRENIVQQVVEDNISVSSIHTNELDYLNDADFLRDFKRYVENTRGIQIQSAYGSRSLPVQPVVDSKGIYTHPLADTRSNAAKPIAHTRSTHFVTKGGTHDINRPSMQPYKQNGCVFRIKCCDCKINRKPPASDLTASYDPDIRSASPELGVVRFECNCPERVMRCSPKDNTSIINEKFPDRSEPRIRNDAPECNEAAMYENGLVNNYPTNDFGAIRGVDHFVVKQGTRDQRVCHEGDLGFQFHPPAVRPVPLDSPGFARMDPTTRFSANELFLQPPNLEHCKPFCDCGYAQPPVVASLRPQVQEETLPLECFDEPRIVAGSLRPREQETLPLECFDEPLRAAGFRRPQEQEALPLECSDEPLTQSKPARPLSRPKEDYGEDSEAPNKKDWPGYGFFYGTMRPQNQKNLS